LEAQNANQKYDRDFLLSPEKRNQIVELWEVEKYGRDCFNDPNHVHLYGMPPKEWYERGVRILARTCLEAVKDPLGNKIGHDIAEVVTRASGNRAVGVVDPFAGSCNGLYAILRHLPGAKGIGFEVEPAVFDLTTRNIAHLSAPIELVPGSYKDLVGSVAVIEGDTMTRSSARPASKPCIERSVRTWSAESHCRQGAEPNRSTRKSRKTLTLGRRWRPGA